MIDYSFTCRGHKNISAKHYSTLEFTKESIVTTKGDCILGVNSSVVLKELPETIKKAMRNENSKIHVSLQTTDSKDVVSGYGSPLLTLSSDNAMIIRKSSYICSRTLLIKADKAAADISRNLVKSMKNPDTILTITLQVEEG